MNKECLIFLNAKAGALKVTPGLEKIEEMCKTIGLDAEVLYPKSVNDLRSQIRQAIKNGVKKVVVAGGDGTVRIAAQELVHSDVALGIIPQGTFNNFAHSLHLPTELILALKVIKEGKVQKVGVGRIDKHYFTEAAGVGIFADMLALYGKGTNKNILKGVRALILILFSLPRHRIQIKMDGKVVVERAVMCTIANTFRIGQAHPIAPDAHLTDDHLDVVVVGDLKRRELLSYYRAMRAQVHENLPKVTIYKAKHILLDSSTHLNVHCDDQIVGSTPIEVIIEPQSLRVLVEKI